MKKSTFIAALVLSTSFFMSCESTEIRPSIATEKPSVEDFVEPEFKNQAREKAPVIPSVTAAEVPAAIKPLNVIAD
jgi:hypothetical protein